MEYRLARSYIIGKWLPQYKFEDEKWTNIVRMPDNGLHSHYAMSHERALRVIEGHKNSGTPDTGEELWDALPRYEYVP